MAVLTDRALSKALRARAFDRAYYLHGEDEYRKEEAVRRLIAAATDPATRDFNLDVRQGAQIEASALASLLATPPMMAERRLIVIRDAGALRKDARAVLDHHLERRDGAAESADIVVVLVAPAGEKSRADRSLAERASAVEFTPLSEERVEKWITHHAEGLGATIDPRAAALLQRALGNDLGALAAELDKLASYANGAAIDEHAVGAVVGVRHGETLGDWLDRVAARDVAGSLALLPHILDQPKTTAVSVVMALTTQTLALAWGAARRESGTPAGRLGGEYFDFLKRAGGAYTGRPWGEAVAAWCRTVDEWDAAALDRALEALLATDVALKETRLSSDEQLLTNLLLALCTTALPAVPRPSRRIA